MRVWLIKKLGGFTDIHDLLESISDEKEKDRILTKAIEKLFNSVSVYDIVRNENGVWMFGDRILTDVQYAILKEQAESFKKSFLFKVLDIDFKYNCNKKMRASVTNQELQIAKVVEYTFDILKNRLSKF